MGRNTKEAARLANDILNVTGIGLNSEPLAPNRTDGPFNSELRS